MTNRVACYKCLFGRPHAFHDDGTENEDWVPEDE